MIKQLKELKFLENIVLFSVIGFGVFASIPDKSAKNHYNGKYKTFSLYNIKQTPNKDYLMNGDSLEREYLEKYIAKIRK